MNIPNYSGKYPLYNHFDTAPYVIFNIKKDEIRNPYIFLEREEDIYENGSAYTDVTDILLEHYDRFFGMTRGEIRKIMLLYIKGSCNFPEVLYDSNLRKILL